jgi:hypothetical protein
MVEGRYKLHEARPNKNGRAKLPQFFSYVALVHHAGGSQSIEMASNEQQLEFNINTITLNLEMVA